MFKRIVGVLLLLGGLALTVLTAVMLAYDIPRNFTVTGEGLDAVIELIEKYGLNMNFRCGPFCCNEMEFGGHVFRRKKLYAFMIRYAAPAVMAILFLQSTGFLK